MREVVETERDFDQALFDYETAGWETIEKAQGRAVMERDLRGTWIWHLLYFFLAPVYGNLVYSAFRRYNRPERIVIRQQMDAREAADIERDVWDGDGSREDSEKETQ